MSTATTTADGANRTFTYDGNHLMTRNDVGGTYETANYTNHVASSVNIGGAGLAPGQSVRFKVKLGIDPSFAAAYAASFGSSRT